MDLQFHTDENNIAFTYVNGVKGTLNRFDAEVLIRHMSDLKEDSKYVETGSYLGCSGVIAGLTMKGKPIIYCHDLWVQDMNELATEGSPPPKTDDYFYQFYKNVCTSELHRIVIPIRGDSAYTLGIHEDESIDLAFIDGDHSYEGVIKDLEAIYDKMKPGAVILCHDCQPGNEVERGIASFVKSKNIDDVSGYHHSSIVSIVKK